MDGLNCGGRLRDFVIWGNVALEICTPSSSYSVTSILVVWICFGCICIIFEFEFVCCVLDDGRKVQVFSFVGKLEV